MKYSLKLAFLLPLSTSINTFSMDQSDANLACSLDKFFTELQTNQNYEQPYFPEAQLFESNDLQDQLNKSKKQNQITYIVSLLFFIAQHKQKLENLGKTSKPLSRHQRIAEIQKIHDNLMQKNQKTKVAKFQQNRSLYACQDTHLSHHGHRNQYKRRK